MPATPPILKVFVVLVVIATAIIIVTDPWVLWLPFE
jgi:hypothetical protein